MTSLSRGFQEHAPRRRTRATVGTQVEIPAVRDPRAGADGLPREIGGVDGPEPTRFGDWEHKGRCTDF